jgi:hypothetical protein
MSGFAIVNLMAFEDSVRRAGGRIEGRFAASTSARRL